MEEMLGVAAAEARAARRASSPMPAAALLDHARIVLQQVDTMRGDLSAPIRAG